MAKGLGPVGSIGGKGAAAIASISRGGIPSLGLKSPISIGGPERASSISSPQARSFDTPRSADLRSFLKNSVRITRPNQIGFRSSPKPSIESVKSNIPLKINIPLRGESQTRPQSIPETKPGILQFPGARTSSADQSRGQIISFNPETARTKPVLKPDVIQPARARPGIEVRAAATKIPETVKAQSLLEQQIFFSVKRSLALARAVRTQQRVAPSPAVQESAQTQPLAQSRSESVPKTETLPKVKVTQAEKTEILAGQHAINKTVRRSAAQGRRIKAAIQKAHDINERRANSLKAAYEKIEKEKGIVRRDDLTRESGFLGDSDESPLIDQLGLNKKDGSKLRIVKEFDPVQVKKSEIPGLVLKNTAVRLADKDAVDPATDREIKNVLTLPDVLEGPIDYERTLRKVLVQELKREAVTGDANIPASEVAEKTEDKITDERVVPNNTVVFPGLNPFISARLALNSLDSEVHNNIVGIKEREELFKIAA